MPTFTTDLYDARLLAGGGAKLTPAQAYGRVRHFTFATPAVAAWAQNDDLNIFIAEKGWTLLPLLSRIQWQAFGAAVTLDLGNKGLESATDDDDDRFIAAKSIAAAGSSHLDAEAGLPSYTFTQRTLIRAILEGGDPTNNARLWGSLAFVLD